jgi:outer membrane protein OmpA-like peptidoglycan-associated protein
VVATQKLPQGEFWYIYQGGSGNSDSRGSFTLSTVQLAALAQDVVVQTMKAPLDTTAKCSDPPWLVKQFAQYKVSGCDSRIWDVVPFDIQGGHKDIEGARTTVTYTLTDEKKTETAATIQKNYMQAFKALGLAILSDPNDANNVIVSSKTPAGGFWFHYQHGSGNDQDTGSYDLTTVQVTPFPQVVQAQLMKTGLTPQPKGCKNPDWLVKQFPYFAVGDCSYRDFDQLTLTLPNGQKKVLAGRILDAHYTLSDQARVPTALYVWKNYANALQAIGAKLVSDPKDADTGIWMQTTPQGEYWYIYGKSSGNAESVGSYVLTTVQVGGPPPKACTLEVYGINFDFNKATLRPESEPVLRQLLAMFNADQNYFAELGGHTDNVGTAAYNQKLSEARAVAVKAWLVSHGIGEQRITPKGYGDTRPLVPNTTDANRFKNRRVELKRANCK